MPDVDNKSIIELKDKLQEQDPEGRHISNIGGWQHELNSSIENTAISNMLKQSTEIVNQIFIREYKLKLKRNIQLQNRWINENFSNTHNTKHCHPGATFVGVYYVSGDKSETNGSLSFTRSSLFEQHSAYHDICDLTEKSNDLHQTEYNRFQFDINPSGGTAVFFPPWYTHQVLPNKTGSQRISIAMNFK